MRVWISGVKSYLPAAKIGSAVPGFAVAQVIKSSPGSRLPEGCWVTGVIEWSEYAVVSTKQVQRVPVEIDLMYKYLSVYGPTGLTSYLSIRR